MNAQKTSPLANIDPVALELLLSDRLQDPTPAVLRVCNFPTNFVPFEDMHPLQYMKQSQLHFISSNPIRPLADPPERKESNMHKQPAPPKSIRAKNNFYIESPPSKSHPEPITPALTSHRCLERTGDRHKYIIGELVLTEEAYVIDLDILASAFSMPLCNYARSKEMALDEMLNPLQKLILFQRQFLQHLHKAAAAANVFAVARLFASEASGFKIYMEYCSTYHQITNALDHFEFDPVWQKLLNNNQPQASNGSRKCRLSLRDLLIKPVQRICKYPLFLSELRKYTAKGSDPDTYAEIDHSLLLIKGICAGIDKEQQYGESLKLRRAILDSYCDNPTLPVSLVARLGTISLSGPLQICVCNTEKAKAIHLFGCVLFKRFLIILKAEKPKQLIPHFWFPMHNMALVDDNTECSWRLQHIKSNQHMRFGARSAQEKKVWVNKLKEVISVSVAKASMSYRRRCAVDTAQSPCLQPLESLQHPARHSNTPIKQKHTRGGWPPWQSSFSLAMEKTGKIEANFKAFTSPEIIRIATLERLKGNTPPPLKTKLTVYSQPAPQLSTPPRHESFSKSYKQPCQQSYSVDTSPILYIQRRAKSFCGETYNENRYTAYNVDIIPRGAASISPKSLYQVEDQCNKCKCKRRRCLCVDNDNSRIRNVVHSYIPTLHSKPALSEKLLGIFGYSNTGKRSSVTSTLVEPYTTVAAQSKVDSRCSQSFDIHIGTR